MSECHQTVSRRQPPRSRRGATNAVPPGDGGRGQPSSLAPRSAPSRVTGYVAESVPEKLLDNRERRVLWHFTDPDAMALISSSFPDDKITAVEVKGTLVAGCILTGRRLAHLKPETASPGHISKPQAASEHAVQCIHARA